MKFGKRLRDQLEDTLPEWRNKFLKYKDLKKRLKHLSAPACFTTAAVCLPASPTGETLDEAAGSGLDKMALAEAGGGVGLPSDQRSPSAAAAMEDAFICLLDRELSKFNHFFMEKEEEFVIRLQDLKERIERARRHCSSAEVAACDDCAERVNDIRTALVGFHGEMILLVNYSSMNYMGLVKILKKHDKRTGSLLRHPYIHNVLRQPFYTPELLRNLVRECEGHMRAVFPPPADPSMLAPSAGELPLAAGTATEDVGAVLRGTLAALRSLHELSDSKTPQLAHAGAACAAEPWWAGGAAESGSESGEDSAPAPAEEDTSGGGGSGAALAGNEEAPQRQRAVSPAEDAAGMERRVATVEMTVSAEASQGQG